MEQSGPRPASWTFGGVAAVALLALAWLGTAGSGAWSFKGQVSPAKAESAGLQVVVTDGTAARVWIERAGSPPRAMPLSCETLPGPVAVRVARLTADGAWRQDTVELDLQPGRLHLVPIGGMRVRIEAQERLGPPRELPWRHPFPGVVSRAQDGTCGLGDPRQEPMPMDTVLVVQPDYAAEGDWLPARERLLVAVNPFLQEIRIRVETQHANKASGWQQECTLGAFGCRVFSLGPASGVRVSCTRTEDGAALGESRYTPPGAECRVLYTVGGATRYAWVGYAEGRMQPVPAGEWAELPEGLEIRPRQVGDPAHWLLAARGPGGEVGLAPVVSAPLVQLGPPSPVQARADVVARELALPAELRNRPVAAVAAAGGDLWGVVDGVVHDLRTGKPLHAREPELVAQMAATPHGLVLVTRSGRLATLADGRVVTGALVYDPAVRLAPAVGDPPAVWLYGWTLIEATLLRQPLDGSPGMLQKRAGEENPHEAEEAYEESGEYGDESGTPAEKEPALLVTAVAAAGGDALLVARGRRIERMQSSPEYEGVWDVEPVLTLPEGGPDVTGLLDLDGRLLFATEECVYELRGDLVLPLVEGIGGPLVPWRGGLVVCDARSGRLYHLSGPALAPKGEPR